MSAPLFLSSGNLTADRRYDYARDLQLRGDDQAAADLYAQAAEIAPDFASAWFALAECNERLNQHGAAIEAYRKAAAADPQDRHGANLRLMRFGAAPLAPMPEGYVRTLFDQYAPKFEQSLLEDLAYRGPHLLFAAVLDVRRAERKPALFSRGIDLGCGTGLAGRAFASNVDAMIGVDLSPGMLAHAKASGCYAELETADMVSALQARKDGSFDLVLAADAVVYLPDLAPLLYETARVLKRDGLLAFTVETHSDEGIILGEGLRYAHSEAYVRGVVRDAGLAMARLDHGSTRTENHKPVPSLIIVARKDA